MNALLAPISKAVGLVDKIGITHIDSAFVCSNYKLYEVHEMANHCKRVRSSHLFTSNEFNMGRQLNISQIFIQNSLLYAIFNVVSTI